MPTNRHIEKAEVELYAKTLLEAANESGGLDAVIDARGQLEQIIAYNRSHVELTESLSDPARSAQQRAALVKGVFSNCQPALQSVLGVMAERDKIQLLPRVFESFDKQIGDALNIAVVDVTTCVSLDDRLREMIKNKVSADLGVDVVLNEHVDKSILGGIIMTTRGRRIDASVASLLDNARTTLKQNDGGEARD